MILDDLILKKPMLDKENSVTKKKRTLQFINGGFELVEKEKKEEILEDQKYMRNVIKKSHINSK